MYLSLTYNGKLLIFWPTKRDFLSCHDDAIEFVNRKGLELLKCDDFDEIKGRPYSELFSLDETRREQFQAKCKNRDWTPEVLKVTLFDKTTGTMQVNITFADDGSGKLLVSSLMKTEMSNLTRNHDPYSFGVSASCSFSFRQKINQQGVMGDPCHSQAQVRSHDSTLL